MGAEASKAERRLDAAARPDDVRTDFVVIGGGPAGLTAAYELAKASRRPGRRSRNGARRAAWPARRVYKGFHFDMGGHRFFTKSRK